MSSFVNFNRHLEKAQKLKAKRVNDLREKHAAYSIHIERPLSVRASKRIRWQHGVNRRTALVYASLSGIASIFFPLQVMAILAYQRGMIGQRLA